ncbi:MAG: hypothetical protein V1745_01525 [Patescibacteria group bacterium]
MERPPGFGPKPEQNPFRPPETKESERKVELKIANAFLHQKYPLSEKGLELRERLVPLVETLKRNASDPEAGGEFDKLASGLPTVEEPHLDLFRDFDLTPEEETRIFGPELACVQVTKGCRHQCSHCAAGAEKRVQIMPFAAVLKTAEIVKHQSELTSELWHELKDTLPKFLSDAEIQSQAEKVRAHAKSSIDSVAGLNSAKGVKEIINRSVQWMIRISNDVDKKKTRKSEEDEFRLRQEIGTMMKMMHARPEWKKLESKVGNLGARKIFLWDGASDPKFIMTNYYDSDPFDYRDTTFLHVDGAPADYGDVVKVFDGAKWRVEITTAGYPLQDSIAQRAAEKIAAMPTATFYNFRISVHPYEKGTSHGDPATYVGGMENVIRTLAPMHPGIVIFPKALKGKLDESMDQAILEIYMLAYFTYMLDVRGWDQNTYQPPSRFSGRAVEFERDESDIDIMACLPGSHIWPDGTVARQDIEDEAVKKGARPKPVGKKLY